ncbi:MAG: hypothetical protein TU35_008915 [Thermoproteus sp. AZ2]|uniref:Uncharacterized protein n=1 Tax=Thermoproteus sp. AZ2 TaxID=1609232 RepID=A0ACC6V3W1_9CREN
MILIAAESGVLTAEGATYCCEGLDVNDAAEGLICAWQGLYRLGGELERMSERRCWRLIPWDDDVLASLEGPLIFSARRSRALADYRPYAKGWFFFHGEPHITDMAQYKGQYVAGVEVGSLLMGPTPLELRPLEFSEDIHNLLPLGGRLLVATASGIYATEGLSRFELKAEGYAHALARAGGAVAAHVMAERPVIVSRDEGETWRNLGLKLPEPAFGTTGLLCEGEICIYSTSETYRLDLRRAAAEKLFGPHPMARRVVKIG